jgi:hypothetical protein
VPVTTTDCSSPSAGNSCWACAGIGRLKQATRLAAMRRFLREGGNLGAGGA